MSSQFVANKPSMLSLGTNHPGLVRNPGSRGISTAPGTAVNRRPCSNCTCSPGLLSRQKRRQSLIRQFSRNSSISGPRKSVSSESIYSSDSVCATKNINTTKRLESLRNKMKEHDLAVYIVPSEDEHQSEYVAGADQRRSFISGFTGSAGIALITRDLLNFNEVPEGKSALSTDGRYFAQAAQELDFNWLLLKQGAKNEPTWQEWAIKEAIEQSLGTGKLVKIGIDPKVISYKQTLSFEQLIKKKIEEDGNKGKVEFVAIKQNLVDQIWPEFEELPQRPSNELILLDEKFTGESFKSKLERLQKELSDHGSKTILLSALDEIAWFLNLRGSDIEFNPVFFSYLIVSGNDVKLFSNNELSDDVKTYLKDCNVQIHQYEQIWTELSSVANVLKETSEIISIPENASWEIIRNLNNCKFKQIHSPIDFFKSVKNPVEIKNFDTAQLKDAVALIKYFAWLEDTLIREESLIDEYIAAEKLVTFRKEQAHFQGNSFETISSTGQNAAIIHYSPPKENSSIIDPSKIYLCDSGSQFLEGTTDITRTYHFMIPTQEEIDNFTYVLKGNLAIEQLTFPEGTNGYMIDVLARQFLWSQGLDYRHGTGHGVGAFLNVHEGPIGISWRPSVMNFPLKVGNVITNEPGYYEDGKYGIRIENNLVIEETKLKFGDKPFLKFRNMTLVPYGKRLINKKLLSKEEITVIDKYHQKIWHMVSPHIDRSSFAYLWLKKETTPL